MAKTQLVVTTPPHQAHRYNLDKNELSIGRFPANDIVLVDLEASRQHARLLAASDGFDLIDLASRNGTFVNGQRITRAHLGVGDSFTIGSSTLQLQEGAEAPANVPQTVGELAQAIDTQTIEIELPTTDVPRLTITQPGHTWEYPLVADALTIGRDPSSQIVLADPGVSRQHVRLVKQSGGYLLTDLNSQNGTWLQGQRITQRLLRAGDMLQIGSALIVYKSPIDQAAVTQMIERPAQSARSAARRPVIFIPGFMGSELWRGSEQIWPNVTAMFTHPDWYRWPSPDPIEARRLVAEQIIVPNLIKLARHNELSEFLIEGLGYESGKDYIEFPWDWRQDLRAIAQQLYRRIQQWREQVAEARLPITIVAHSMGCLVARYYVERLGGKEFVNRLVLIGGPHSGTPKTLQAFAAFGKQPLVYAVAEQFQRVVASLPSTYTMLPSYPAVFNSAGAPVELFSDEAWCPEDRLPLLRNALAFHRELGTACSVSTICIFGYGVQTPTRAILEDRKVGSGWERIRFATENKGDDTVPEESSHLPGAEIHPIKQHHGALYADNDVKMRLKLELVR